MSRLPTLTTIAARAGSKGVQGKNLREIGGKPLIVHTIEQALACPLVDEIAVTSDSPEILEIANNVGVDFLIERPSELASDTAPKIPAIQHCVASVEQQTLKTYDIVVDLDPTSPLRLVSDIEGCIELLVETGAANVITASKARKSPYFNLIERDALGHWRPSKQADGELFTRQSAPACYDMNASIYVFRRNQLMSSGSIWHDSTALFVMPEDRSIDIDTELDFEMVSYLLGRNRSLTAI